MVMRIDIDFNTPLTEDQHLALLLAIAELPKSQRLWVVDGGRGVIMMGEAMSSARIRAALEQAELSPISIISSLNEDEDAMVDEIDPLGTAIPQERLRPIGR